MMIMINLFIILTAEGKLPAELNKTDIIGLYDGLQSFVIQGVVVVFAGLEDG